jgi:hypothetical protein
MLRLGSFACLLTFAGVAGAAPPLVSGDLVLATGDRAIHRLAPGAQDWSTTTGAAVDVTALAPDPQGGFLVGDTAGERILHLDLDSGTVSDLSSPALGTGGPIVNPGDLVADGPDTIAVADYSQDHFVVDAGAICPSRLTRIDRATGDRTSFADEPFRFSTRVDVPSAGAPLYALSPECEYVFAGVTVCYGTLEADDLGVPSASLLLGPYYDPMVDIATTPNGTLYVIQSNEMMYDYTVNRFDAGLASLSPITGSGTGAGEALHWATWLAALSDETLLVFDAYLRALFLVDVATGDRTIVSGDGVGDGLEMTDDVRALALESASSALLANGDDTLLRVDLATGHRSVAWDPVVGAGDPPQSGWKSIAVRRGRPMLAVGGGSTSESLVYRIDPATGDRTLVSGGGQGNGPIVESLALARALPDDGGAIGRARLIDDNSSVLVRIDAATGARSIVSSATVGSGPIWSSAGQGPVAVGPGVAFAASGSSILRVDLATGDRTLLVANAARTVAALATAPDGSLFAVRDDGTLSRYDPTDGAETPISGTSLGAGPGLGSAIDLAIASDGAPLVLVTSCSDSARVQEIIRVDPATGDRTITATRPGTAIAVVPEPAPIALALAALLALATRAGIAQTRRA